MTGNKNYIKFLANSWITFHFQRRKEIKSALKTLGVSHFLKEKTELNEKCSRISFFPNNLSWTWFKKLSRQIFNRYRKFFLFWNKLHIFDLKQKKTFSSTSIKYKDWIRSFCSIFGWCQASKFFKPYPDWRHSQSVRPFWGYSTVFEHAGKTKQIKDLYFFYFFCCFRSFADS